MPKTEDNSNDSMLYRALLLLYRPLDIELPLPAFRNQIILSAPNYRCTS